ncbi:MAG TPA: NF038122 family metalloprotease [Caulobacteraceae bacterium]|nr:NF038122 family metalloprotease [Caulobacteraceae bacterium]
MLESGAVMKVTLGGLLGSAALACSALLMATPAQAITIDPIFSSGCSNCGLPEGDQVSLSTVPGAEAAIEAADAQIASQFGGNMTTHVVYVGYDGSIGFLGASSSGQTLYTYSDYVAALTADASAHPSNTILTTAVANLKYGNGFTDPNALIALNTTAARNLGLAAGLGGDQTPEFDASGNYVGSDGVADAVVFLNINQPLSYTRPIPDVSTGVFYDAETTMEHETDEALGIGGAGSTLNNPSPDIYGPLDLYRYAAPGTPSFDPTHVFVTGCGPPTCTGQPSPYFSVDGGVTSIDTFNQVFPLQVSDAGDWGLNLAALCPGGTGFGGTGDVQDAFSCNNHSADVMPGTPSFDALAAIGYNPAVPEPASWALMLTGVALAGAGLRTSRRRHDMTATVA